MRYLLICALLVACGHNKDDFSHLQKPAEQKVEEVQQQPAHNYAVYMDDEYGYQPAISENQINNGQVATTLMMLKYLGEKNGKYQLFTKQNDNVMTVMECQKPCQFIKLNHIVNGMGVVKTEVLEAAPDSIGKLAFDDAMNGQLEQFVKEDGGKRFTVWLENKKLTRTLIN